jgi:hypothetical protein
MLDNKEDLLKQTGVTAKNLNTISKAIFETKINIL